MANRTMEGIGFESVNNRFKGLPLLKEKGAGPGEDLLVAIDDLSCESYSGKQVLAGSLHAASGLKTNDKAGRVIRTIMECGLERSRSKIESKGR